MFRVENKLRRLAGHLPNFVRRLLGYCWDYSLRLNYWRLILREVRGLNFLDQLRLLASALACPITSLGHFGRWKDPVLLWKISVRVSNIGIFSLRQKTDDLWHVVPAREPAVLHTIRSRLRPGAVFVDAGANIGFYTVLAAKLVGSTGCVIAVEMMPETACILREHVSLNNLRNVRIFESALADVHGKEVVARVPAGQHGQASIASGVAEGGAEVRVLTTTLDRILSGIGHISLMKMDLEGAEELAISGAGNALRRIDAIIFEDWGEGRLTGLFESRGFRVERLDGNNCLAVNRGGRE